MTTDPLQVHVTRSESFDRVIRNTFGVERSVDGRRPSVSDFETLCWPDLRDFLSAYWQSAYPVDDEHPEVKALVTAPFRGIFPPSRVVFVVKNATVVVRGINQIRPVLVLIGIDFDWSFRWPR